MKSTAAQKRIEQRKRGHLAELEVREILNHLDKTRFAVYNNIPARYGNIDHLVISREGAVFLIETKGHRGRISVDRSKVLLNGSPMLRDPVAQVNRNIKWLREQIRDKLGCSTWITSILLFTNAIPVSSKGKPVLRLRPVHRMNIIGKGHLRHLIESYYPRTPRRRIWNRREVLLI